LRSRPVETLIAALPKGASVLEVGAGCLRNSFALQKRGFSVAVWEVPTILERFPENYERFRQRGGTLHFEMPKLKFDLILATFVFETICDPTVRLSTLISVRKALKSKAPFVFSVRGPRDLVTAEAMGRRCSDGFFTPNLSFARSYTPRQAESLLKDAGFKEWSFLHRKINPPPELLSGMAWS